jgi:hypothetical protein
MRTRYDGEVALVDPNTFVKQQVAGWIDSRGPEAGRAAIRLGLVPLSLDVEGEQFTFNVSDGPLGIRRGVDE